MAYVKTNWVDNTTPIDENNLNKIEQGIKNNDINIGEENYDNTKTYEVGDIVRYNEKIYKCITAITTAENFDISKWEQTNIVEIVQSEKSKIYELIEALSTPIVGEGENITLNDTAEKRFENFDIEGNSEQEATPSPDYPSEVKSCGDNGSINEVICNKNLFNVSVLNDCSQNGITLTRNEGTNKIKLNVTPTKDFTLYSKDLDVNMFEIGEKYSLSKDFSNIIFNFEVFENNSNTASIWATSITMQKSYTRVRVYVQGKANTTFNNQEIALQLEKGNATEIVAHQSQTYTIPVQQPMRSIGDTRDKFILKENGKWYEHHPVIRKIFDGSENFNLGTNANSLIYFFTNAGSIKAKSQDLLCNKLTTVTNLWNETENKNLIAIRSSLDLFNIMLSDTTINTVEKFKSWLSEQYNAGTPVYVDYVLATPLDIECTSEQTEILNQIYIKAKSYKGVTHIYSNDEVSPNCYVEAVKDLTTLIQ